MNIPNSAFIVIDIILIAVIVFCLIKGILNGFVYGFINLIFLTASSFFAWFISPVLANKVALFTYTSENAVADKLIEQANLNLIINNLLWFIIITVVLNLLFALIKPLFKTISKIPIVGGLNKFLGGLLGFVRGFVICILISIFLSLPIIKNNTEVKNETILKYVEGITDEATKFLVKNINFDELIKDANSFDVDKARENLSKWLIEQGILDE